MYIHASKNTQTHEIKTEESSYQKQGEKGYGILVIFVLLEFPVIITLEPSILPVAFLSDWVRSSYVIHWPSSELCLAA